MTKTLSECPYCNRPACEDGSILHATPCAGLETVDLNRLQFDNFMRAYEENAQLRGNLSLAEEGLASAMQEIERLNARVAQITQGNEAQAINGGRLRDSLSQMESQRDHWLEVAREKDVEIEQLNKRMDFAITALGVVERRRDQLRGEAEVADEQLAQLRGFAEAHKTCVGLDELAALRSEAHARNNELTAARLENDRLRQANAGMIQGLKDADAEARSAEPGVLPICDCRAGWKGCEKQEGRTCAVDHYHRFVESGAPRREAGDRAGPLVSRHTTEDDFKHFLSYSKLSAQPADELGHLRLAYYAGADKPSPDVCQCGLVEPACADSCCAEPNPRYRPAVKIGRATLMATYFHCGIWQNIAGHIQYSSGIIENCPRIETADNYNQVREALAEKAGVDPEKFIMTALNPL